MANRFGILPSGQSYTAPITAPATEAAEIASRRAVVKQKAEPVRRGRHVRPGAVDVEPAPASPARH